jgi:hypothetical protein
VQDGSQRTGSGLEARPQAAVDGAREAATPTANAAGLQPTQDDGAEAPSGHLRQNDTDTRHARGMLKWAHGPSPQVAQVKQNAQISPLTPLGLG